MCKSYLAVWSLLSDDIDCEPQEITCELQPPSGTSNGAQRRRAEDGFSRTVGSRMLPYFVCNTPSVSENHTQDLVHQDHVTLVPKVSIEWPYESRTN